MQTRAKTKTEDGLVHVVMEIAERRSEGYYTVCSMWSEGMLPDDPPVTCFSCLEFLRQIEYIDERMREAMRAHIGRPLTQAAKENALRVAQELIDNWKKA